MEERLQPEEVQTFSRQHANGEVFEAQNIEVARGMCPVLGKMSLEEAGLLLELESMGREQMDNMPDKSEIAAAEKPVIERIESTIKPEMKPEKKPDKQKLPAGRQTKTVVEPATHDSNKDIISEVLAEDKHNSFLAQQEYTKSAVMTEDVDHKEPTGATLQPLEIVQAKPIYSPLRAEEIFSTVRMSEETAPDIEEPITQESNVATIREAISKHSDTEPILAVDEASFINTEVAIQADDIADVVHEAVLQSQDEQLHESSEEQIEPEVDLHSLAELAEPIEVPEGLTEYDLPEEDEANLLMPTNEQSTAEIEENSELPLAEIIAVEPAETEILSLTPAEIQAVASVPELPAPVEEIELAITQLTEALELIEADESQEVYQILEEIITLPDTLDTGTVEAEQAVEEKLEVLFIRLFEETDIEYTSDLLKSFIKLTKAHYLEELLPIAIETEEDIQAFPEEIGTREFLQKLQHVLSTMKKTVIHFYEIGKSALRLYDLNIPIALTD